MSRPNFIIVEGGSKDSDYMEYYDDFRRDYIELKLDGYEMNKKYNHIPQLTRKRWRDKIKEEKGIIRRDSIRPIRREMQHISKQGKNFQITKCIKGKHYHFGTYPSVETAKMVRDRLFESNWDLELGKELKEEYGVKKSLHPSFVYARSRYDEFEELYEDKTLRIPQILEMLDFTTPMYLHCLEIYREKHPDAPRKRSVAYSEEVKDKIYRNKKYKNPLHNIKTQNNGEFTVFHAEDKVYRTYGTYTNLQDAINQRNSLMRNNWQ